MRRVAAVVMALVTAIPAAALDANSQPPLRLMSRPERAVPFETPPPVATPQEGDETEPEIDAAVATTLSGQRNLLRLDDETQATCLAALRDLGVV